MTIKTLANFIYNIMMIDIQEKRVFPVWIEIMTFFLVLMICIMVSVLFSIILDSWAGFDITKASEAVLNENRSLLRLSLMNNNAMTFLVPGVLFSILLYRQDWLETVGANRFPKWMEIAVGIVIVFVMYYFFIYLARMNAIVPIPEWLGEAEQNINKGLLAVMNMDSIGELLANLVVLAIVPAIGEEWIFRGFLQDKLHKKIKNEHIAIWVIALIFSAMHMQFLGFLPRMFAGIVMGYLFVWSRSLWLPIIVHSFHNGFQIIWYYFETIGGKDPRITIGENPEVVWWQATLSFIGFLGLMLFFRNISTKKKDDSFA